MTGEVVVDLGPIIWPAWTAVGLLVLIVWAAVDAAVNVRRVWKQVTGTDGVISQAAGRRAAERPAEEPNVTSDESGGHITSWRPPPWAASTVLADGGVKHTYMRSVAGALLDDESTTTVEVWLVQRDMIDVGDDGRNIRVVRGEPSVMIEEHRFSLNGAAQMQHALADLLVLATQERRTGE
jgi:hypothetical protein